MDICKKSMTLDGVITFMLEPDFIEFVERIEALKSDSDDTDFFE